LLEVGAARPLLRVRLFRVADNDPELLGHLVKVQLEPDLVAALALDLPTTVRTCNQDDIDHWDLPVDELFAIATDNLAAEVAGYQRDSIELQGGGSIQVLLGDTFFVSSQAYRFAQLVGPLTNGALLALPNRHQLLWHVIESAPGTIGAVQALVQIASAGYREGPGSLTPDIYWWHGGAFTRLPATVDRSGLHFMPPEAFVQLLNSLA